MARKPQSKALKNKRSVGQFTRRHAMLLVIALVVAVGLIAAVNTFAAGNKPSVYVEVIGKKYNKHNDPVYRKNGKPVYEVLKKYPVYLRATPPNKTGPALCSGKDIRFTELRVDSPRKVGCKNDLLVTARLGETKKWKAPDSGAIQYATTKNGTVKKITFWAQRKCVWDAHCSP